MRKTTALGREALSSLQRPLWRVLAVALLASLLNLVSPWPLKILIDNCLSGVALFGHVLSRRERLFSLIFRPAFYGILTALRGHCNAKRYEWLIDLSEGMHARLSQGIFSHLMRLPVSFFDRASTGEITSRLLSDTQKLKESFVEAVTIVTSEALTLIGAFVVLWQLDRIYSLLVLAVLSPLFVIFAKFPEKIRNRADSAARFEGERAGFVQERMQGVREIKASGQEQREGESFERFSRQSAKERVSCAAEEGRFIFLIEVVSGLGFAAVMGYGGYRVWDGSLTLGALIVFVQYLNLLYSPVGRISRLFAVAQHAVASESRIEEVLSAPPEKMHNARLPERSPAIRFEAVTFRYDSGPVVLNGLNLHIREGEKVAIVGTTGVGKSSLVQILAYGYPIQSGRITIGGVSLESLSPAEVRSKFALVSQEPRIFSGSLWDNVRYAAPHATRDEVEEAIRLSHLEDLIARLPEGFNTSIGEMGATLSGGERQRLALARALLKKAPVLILDEPTSAVDAQSEREILSALESAIAGKTVLLITHRPTLLRLAQRVLFLEDGKLHEHPLVPETLKSFELREDWLSTRTD